MSEPTMEFRGTCRVDGDNNPIGGPVSVKEVSRCAMAGVCMEVKKREERLEGLLREARSLLPPHHELKLKIDAALKEEK